MNGNDVGTTKQKVFVRNCGVSGQLCYVLDEPNVGVGAITTVNLIGDRQPTGVDCS